MESRKHRSLPGLTSGSYCLVGPSSSASSGSPPPVTLMEAPIPRFPFFQKRLHLLLAAWELSPAATRRLIDTFHHPNPLFVRTQTSVGSVPRNPPRGGVSLQSVWQNIQEQKEADISHVLLFPHPYEIHTPALCLASISLLDIAGNPTIVAVMAITVPVLSIVPGHPWMAIVGHRWCVINRSM